MVLESAVSATQTEYEERRSKFLRQSFVYAAVSIVTDACCAVLAFIVALELFGDTPLGWVSGAIFMTLMTLPVTGLIAVHALQQEKVLDGLTAQREAALRDAVERADLESTRGQRQGQHQEFEARPAERAGDGRERDRGARGRPGRVLGDLARRAGGVAPRRQQPRPPRAGRDRRTRRPGAGLPGGVAEPVPGGAAGADPAVPRQRRARRVPEAAEPPERRVRARCAFPSRSWAARWASSTRRARWVGPSTKTTPATCRRSPSRRAHGSACSASWPRPSSRPRPTG